MLRPPRRPPLNESKWIALLTLAASLGVKLDPAASPTIATLCFASAGGVMVFTRDHRLFAAVETTVATIEDAQASLTVSVIATAASG